MVGAGVLDPGARAELIEGRVLDMAPAGRRHVLCVDRLIALLAPAVEGRAVVCAYQPIHLDERSEPRPDLVVARQCPDRLQAGGPQAGSVLRVVEVLAVIEVLLVIEVVDASLAGEIEGRCLLYARGGVEELWMVDLDREEVAVMRRPSPEGYRQLRRSRPGEVLELPGLAGITVAVDLAVAEPACS